MYLSNLAFGTGSLSTFVHLISSLIQFQKPFKSLVTIVVFLGSRTGTPCFKVQVQVQVQDSHWQAQARAGPRLRTRSLTGRLPRRPGRDAVPLSLAASCSLSDGHDPVAQADTAAGARAGHGDSMIWHPSRMPGCRRGAARPAAASELARCPRPAGAGGPCIRVTE